MLGDARFAEAAADVRELRLVAPRELAWFRGHFDGNPILAAVVQMREVTAWLAATWPDLGAPTLMKKLKFKSPIRPEQEIVLRLSRRSGAREVVFSLSRGGAVCSSGTLELASP